MDNPLEASPPATRTSPLCSIVIAAWVRAVFMLAVVVQVPVEGLYSSALVSQLPLGSWPPATRTGPSPSRGAEAASRPLFMLPVVVQVPVEGLNNSELVRP